MEHKIENDKRRYLLSAEEVAALVKAFNDIEKRLDIVEERCYEQAKALQALASCHATAAGAAEANPREPQA